jgi:hypothetical protein
LRGVLLKNNQIIEMLDDDILKDDELEPELPLDELDIKKKALLDDDVESIEDLVEEEDEIEEPFDDVDAM